MDLWWWRNRSVFLLLILVILWGCGSPEAKKAKHLERGDTYFNEEKYNEAIIEYRNVVQIDPKHGDAHYKLGLCYLKTGKGTEAFRAFSTDKAKEKAELVLSRKPENLDALLLLGGVFIQENKIDEALDTYRRAQHLDPNREETYLTLAQLYVAKRDIKQAEDHLKQAIKVNPKSIIAHLALGRFYMASNRPAEAEEVYKRIPPSSSSWGISISYRRR